MRLHRLVLSAFGPFADTVDLDFDEANDAGLFLLRGDTGAGKTTLLDAISFALFGDVPGVRHSGANLRSDHAGPDVATSVTLEVTLAGERLSITRRPQQRRPSKKGDGFVDDAAKVTLHRFADGDWQPLGSKHREVAALLAPRIGMSAEQFHQVVLLPQGSFATFLHANAEDRRPLLEALFATQRFEAIEGWLKKEADRRSASVNDARDTLWRAVSTTAAHAGIDDPGPDSMEPAAVPDWARSLAETATAHATVADADAAAAGTTLDAARRAHDDAAKLVEHQRRHGEAERRRRELDDLLPTIDAQRVELDGARRAVAVVPLDEACRQRQVELEHAEDLLRAAVSTASALGLPLDDADRLATERDDAVARSGVLKEVEDDTAARPGLEARKVAHVAALAAIAEKRTAISHRSAARPNALAEADARAQAAADAAAKLDGQRARAHQAADVAVNARRRDEWSVELQAATEAVTAASASAERARAAAVAARAERLAGMAAELAAELRAEVACPVCGSTDHPAPAQPGPTAVSADEQARLDTAAEVADAELREAERAEAAVKSELARCLALAGDVAADDAETTERAEVELLEALEATAAGLASARAAADLLRLDEQADAEQLDGLAREEAAEREALAGVDSTLADLDARIAAALDGFDTLAERRQSLDALRSAAEALLDAHRAHQSATVAASAATAALEAAVTRAGFATLAAAREAARPPAAIDTLDEDIRTFEAGVASTEDTLSDPILIAAAASEVPDLAQLAARLAEAERADKEATTAATVARSTAVKLADDARVLSAQLEALAPLLDAAHQASSLNRLASGMSGDNQKRMRLSTYVLAAKLEQVAAVASDRLQRMSGGRYTLEFTDEEDGRGRGGLGLQVTDAWSMTSRSTSTLSGGESFFASLALALALADVVSAESAGAPLETLFIDEGFGSLDAETLDDVMEVLDGLREGGRTIGVVSHVADLRQRIGTQLAVEKTTTGSTASWQAGG